MKNLLLILAFVFGALSYGQAQDYHSAVGLRFGYPIAITYKTFLNESDAFEGYVGLRSRTFFTEFRINAAYLRHNAFTDVERLKWYYGAGAGLALYSFDSGFAGSGGLSITLGGYLGLEYTLEGTPVSFSVDWIPTIYIGGHVSGFGAGNGAIAARYILN